MFIPHIVNGSLKLYPKYIKSVVQRNCKMVNGVCFGAAMQNRSGSREIALLQKAECGAIWLKCNGWRTL